ncbi:MAG: hypothetical protein R3F56_20365 [Planctomycetota bacterium]
MAAPSHFAFCLSLALALPAQHTVQLAYRAMPDFDLLLPDETWVKASTTIALLHARGAGFAAEVDGMTLRVDTDGDGRLDQVSKGLDHHVVLRGKRPDGSQLAYALRLRTSGLGATFAYSSSGAMVGVVEGVPIQVIDQNNDGVFNEEGVDAIVVGKSRAASFLSRVVNLNGALYSLTIDAAGRSATTLPYEGPAGVLDLRSGLRVVGKLEAAVVSDLAGKLSFEVGNARRGVLVPAGVYVFTGGLATKGAEKGTLRAGQMHPLVVAAGGRTTLQWGAPLRAEFSTTRVGDKVTVGRTVRYYGRAGEEWIPPRAFARSPKIEVFDAGACTESQPFDTC